MLRHRHLSVVPLNLNTFFSADILLIRHAVLSLPEERLRNETFSATETNGFHVKAENKRFTTAEFRCHHNRKLEISASQSVCQTTANKWAITIIFPLSTNLVIAFCRRRFLNSLLSAEGSRKAALSLIVLVLCDSLKKSRPYVELFCCSILTGYVHLLQTSVWGVPVPRGPSVGKPTAANQSAGLFAGPPQEDPFDAMNKKKRKKKMQKVDPSILGFSVNAADRVNMGEIQTVED